MGKIGWLLLHDTSFLASEKQKWWGVKNLQVLFILAPDFSLLGFDRSTFIYKLQMVNSATSIHLIPYYLEVVSLTVLIQKHDWILA